jgi:hypothetical protein
MSYNDAISDCHLLGLYHPCKAMAVTNRLQEAFMGYLNPGQSRTFGRDVYIECKYHSSCNSNHEKIA